MMADFGMLTWILASGTLSIVFVMLLTSRRSTVEERIAQLSSDSSATIASPHRGEIPLRGETALSVNLKRRLETDKKKQERRNRLMQAGFYSQDSNRWLIAIRVISMIIPVIMGWFASKFTSIPLATALLLGTVVGLLGMLAPTFILDARKRARQQRIRRALPDAMDVLNVCLEGGISLPSSISRVSQELVSAHPELALELAIVDRETRMGRSVADSMRSFAERFDLEELRSMASVIAQAERYGASVATAIDVFAESMRLKRMLLAETRAQQAVVKVIFPTLLCIFPVLFIVIIGPAAIRIYEVFVVDSPVK